MSDSDNYPDDMLIGEGIGCCNCDSGWRHGCMDDLCINSEESTWCPDAFPCQHCNPHGELL